MTYLGRNWLLASEFPKQNSDSVKAVQRERCIECHLNQQEIFVQQESYSWFIVMYVDLHRRSKGFVTFIDDISMCCAVYLQKRKYSNVFEKFKEFESIVTNVCRQKFGWHSTYR